VIFDPSILAGCTSDDQRLRAFNDIIFVAKFPALKLQRVRPELLGGKFSVFIDSSRLHNIYFISQECSNTNTINIIAQVGDDVT